MAAAAFENLFGYLFGGVFAMGIGWFLIYQADEDPLFWAGLVLVAAGSIAFQIGLVACGVLLAFRIRDQAAQSQS